MKTETKEEGASAEAQTAPFLVGERVTLRTLSRADAPKLLRWINDPDTNRFLVRGDFPMGWQDEVDWLDRASRRRDGEICLGIEVPEAGLVGCIDLSVDSWPDRTGSTGTMIGDPAARGKGYGTEAKMLLLGHAFRRLNLRRVYSKVYSFNEASLRCQKRCGYAEEARLRENIFRDGKYHDMVFLVATRESFEAAEAAWKARKAEAAAT